MVTGLIPFKPRVLFGGRDGCSRGGKRAASRMSAAERERRASNAGNAVLRTYSVGYYSALGKKSWQINKDKLTRAA